MTIYTDSDNHKQSLEYLLTWEWNNDEYYEDALERGVVVAALKLAFFREHPIIRRVRLVDMLCCAWYEISAFISYERGKFYTDFSERALKKLGCIKVFVKGD